MTGFESLKVENVSKAQALQRAGRAGIESSGVCYRLVTEEQFNKFAEHAVPDIMRGRMSDVLLQLVAMGIEDIKDYEFLDKPSNENISEAIELLESNLQAIEQVNGQFKLTALGRDMVLFPLEARLSKVLVSSRELNCSEEVMTLIALLHVESVFFIPNDKRELAKEVLKKFHSREGDFMMLLNVWKSYQGVKGNKQWCFDNFINERNLKTAKDVRSQLVRLWDSSVSSPRQSCGLDTDKVRRSFVRGFAKNVASLQRDGTYRTSEGKFDVTIHPSSCLFGKKPENLLYFELVHTNKLYMRNVMLIDKKWL
jgi:HrpA-like RNA helicase